MAKPSKIVFGDEVLIDLTADTVTKEKLLKGTTAHGPDGEQITGMCEYDANTQDATATAVEILAGKSAYNKGNKVVGEMPNNGAQKSTISSKDEEVKIKQGYHDGSGSVGIADTEKAKLIPENIRQGVEILDIVGNMSGSEDVKAETKTVTPGKNAQVVLPGEGYNYLSQVTVAGIPYVESDNSAGGKTVIIG